MGWFIRAMRCFRSCWNPPSLIKVCQYVWYHTCDWFNRSIHASTHFQGGFIEIHLVPRTPHFNSCLSHWSMSHVRRERTIEPNPKKGQNPSSNYQLLTPIARKQKEIKCGNRGTASIPKFVKSHHRRPMKHLYFSGERLAGMRFRTICIIQVYLGCDQWEG